MTLQRFKLAKLIIVIALAILVGQSVVNKNFLLPIIGIAAALSLLFYFRSKVKEIMVDERDNRIAGQAAILTIRIYAWLTVIAILIFLTKKNSDPTVETIAYVLAYATCGLMLLYSIIFYYCEKKWTYNYHG